MRILGIDPGTAITGYGIVDEVEGELVPVTYGVIRTDSKMDMPYRLQVIFQELSDLLEEYKPFTAGVEEVFFGRNATTAITVGQARGVVFVVFGKCRHSYWRVFSPCCQIRYYRLWQCRQSPNAANGA